LDEPLLLELDLLELLLELELFDPPDLEADLAIYALLSTAASTANANSGSDQELAPSWNGCRGCCNCSDFLDYSRPLLGERG
jgi:hypothetical protein